MSIIRSVLPGIVGVYLLYAALFIVSLDYTMKIVLVFAIAGGAGLATLGTGQGTQRQAPVVSLEPVSSFDLAKASEGVDMVERLHKLNAQNFEGSEIQFDYPGVRGKLTKGKPPVVVQASEKKDEPDMSVGTVEPA